MFVAISNAPAQRKSKEIRCGKESCEPIFLQKVESKEGNSYTTKFSHPIKRTSDRGYGA